MNTSGNLAQALETFSEEARELIAQMEEILLRVEAGDNSDEDMHALFRCAHTIKGSGGLFGLDEAVRFTHVVENVLDRLRKGEIQFSSDLITALLESQDHINAIVNASLDEGIQADAVQRSDVLIEKLKGWMAQKPGKAAASESEAPLPVETSDEVSASSGGNIGVDHWHLSLRFEPCVFADGMDPLTFINYLRNYGEITHIETVTDHLPDLDNANPEMCYLGFEVALKSTAGKQDIESVFDFIADNATIRISPPTARSMSSFGSSNPRRWASNGSARY